MTAITLTRERLTDGTARLALRAPYHPSLPAQARALGGRWSAADKSWHFDERDAARVRDLCVGVYGVDPLAEPNARPEQVTVRVSLDAYDTRSATLWLFGREIAHRPGRDSRVRLGAGVVVVAGGFAPSGGSAKHPALAPEAGTVLEIRDVPAPLVDAERARIEPGAARLGIAEPLVIVSQAPPDAADVVRAAGEQVAALVRATPADGRAYAAMRGVLALDAAERRAFLAELTQLQAQDAF